MSASMASTARMITDGLAIALPDEEDIATIYNYSELSKKIG
jgi:hypothetical protein